MLTRAFKHQPPLAGLVFLLRRISAWTTFEVMAAAVAASSYGTELSKFTQELTAPVCAQADELLLEYAVPAGIFEEEDARCLTVKGSFVFPGFALFVLGAILSVS